MYSKPFDTIGRAFEGELNKILETTLEPGDLTLPCAEKAIAGLYKLANLTPPKVVWYPCPISAAEAVIAYAKKENKGKPKAESEKAVKEAGLAYFGGALWNAGYSAWADYFNEVCEIPIDRNFLEMTESCGFYWTLEGICFASERPSEINLDAEGRLHSETGMSIRYNGSGWGLYHWHGTEVPSEWILDRKTLTAAVALTQENLEVRRAACEMLGWAQILKELNAKTIDTDADPEIGDLLEVQLPGLDRKTKFLRVRCGTGREFAIGIPQEINTALDAQAWMVGLEPGDFFQPEVRT